jgi:hypothetical protein
MHIDVGLASKHMCLPLPVTLLIVNSEVVDFACHGQTRYAAARGDLFLVRCDSICQYLCMFFYSGLTMSTNSISPYSVTDTLFIHLEVTGDRAWHILLTPMADFKPCMDAVISIRMRTISNMGLYLDKALTN